MTNEQELREQLRGHDESKIVRDVIFAYREEEHMAIWCHYCGKVFIFGEIYQRNVAMPNVIAGTTCDFWDDGLPRYCPWCGRRNPVAEIPGWGEQPIVPLKEEEYIDLDQIIEEIKQNKGGKEI
jgi:hypothetical protein